MTLGPIYSFMPRLAELVLGGGGAGRRLLKLPEGAEARPEATSPANAARAADSIAISSLLVSRSSISLSFSASRLQ